MFCPKCGSQLPDNANFCGECGAAVRQANNIVESTAINNSTAEKAIVNTASKRLKANPIKWYLNRWKHCKEEKFKGKKNILWTALNGIIALLLIFRVTLMFFMNIDMNGIIYHPEGDYAYATNYVNNIGAIPLSGKELKIKDTVRIGFKKYEVKKLEIWDSEIFNTIEVKHDVRFINLWDMENLDYIDIRGAFPKLEVVMLKADKVFLDIDEGEKLERIEIESKIDGAVTLGAYGEEANFPNLWLISLVNTVVWNYDNVNADNLSNVYITVSNDYFSSWTQIKDNQLELNPRVEELLLLAINTGKFEITHTIEDLYGTWNYYDSDGNIVFALSFKDSGYVQIKDGLGILGVDLLRFEEVDNNTLSLKADTTDIYGNILSISAPYQLYGKQLRISIFDKELDLLRAK